MTDFHGHMPGMIYRTAVLLTINQALVRSRVAVLTESPDQGCPGSVNCHIRHDYFSLVTPFKRFSTRFLIHKPSRIGIAFDPGFGIRVIRLRTVSYRSVSMTVAFRGICRHNSGPFLIEFELTTIINYSLQISTFLQFFVNWRQGC